MYNMMLCNSGREHTAVLIEDNSKTKDGYPTIEELKRQHSDIFVEVFIHLLSLLATQIMHNIT